MVCQLSSAQTEALFAIAKRPVPVLLSKPNSESSSAGQPEPVPAGSPPACSPEVLDDAKRKLERPDSYLEFMGFDNLPTSLYWRQGLGVAIVRRLGHDRYSLEVGDETGAPLAFAAALGLDDGPPGRDDEPQSFVSALSEAQLSKLIELRSPELNVEFASLCAKNAWAEADTREVLDVALSSAATDVTIVQRHTFGKAMAKLAVSGGVARVMKLVRVPLREAGLLARCPVSHTFFVLKDFSTHVSV